MFIPIMGVSCGSDGNGDGNDNGNGASTTEIKFPVTNLEAAIRQAIDKSEGVIYTSDLEGIAILDALYKGIDDLTGLEYCTGLLELNLIGNHVDNISSLENLTSLTHLSLEENQISDISLLHNPTNLSKLDLGCNHINDISPLQNLTNLTELLLLYNQISDIQPLVNNPGMGDGEPINLAGNPLSTYSVNVYIPQLEARGVFVLY